VSPTAVAGAKERALELVARTGARAGLVDLLLRVADGGAGTARTRFQILLYHRVNDDRHPFFGGLPTAAFGAQMSALAKWFRVLPLAEIVERAAKDDLPPRALAITFDDGYRDNYENAFPVLRRLRLPATIFLTTDFIGTERTLWHDRLAGAVTRTTLRSAACSGLALDFTSRIGRRDAFRALAGRLRSLPNDEKLRELTAIETLLEPTGRGSGDALPRIMLDWDEVRAMSREGIAFGAHTATHAILTRIPLPEARAEIERSRDAVRANVGCDTTLFAYPNGREGDFNPSIQTLVREAGFKAAVSTVWGGNTARTDRFALRRQPGAGRDMALFGLRTAWYRMQGSRER
jgi:peptidoglycan/xylan/chitin deacetylase (PgdA/CDA1 family)